MTDDRLRVPVDQEYVAAIGLATYCFARMEWDAVYCGNKLMAGYINLVSTKTAGQIALDIIGFGSLIQDALVRDRYTKAALEFRRLAKRRNDLVHSNPATVAGQQRLVRRGVAWDLKKIECLADEFTLCSIELNDLLHNVL